MVDLVGGTGDVLGRLAAAMVAGIVLGVNRELRGKPAGVRTHGLVAIGSCLVTVIVMELSSPPEPTLTTYKRSPASPAKTASWPTSISSTTCR